MICLDTNVLIRYFVEDTPRQAKVARTIIEQQLSPETPGFVSIVTLVELIWVLEDRYTVSRSAVIEIVALLLDAPQLIVEHSKAVEQALQHNHTDLADSLIHEIGRLAGCTKTITFDKKFARLDGIELLQS
jgi:predicted nucleic-acid-binding protein